MTVIIIRLLILIKFLFSLTPKNIKETELHFLSVVAGFIRRILQSGSKSGDKIHTL